MAHQWTPTYPEFRISFVEGALVTTMSLFNKRKDTEYYEIQVFDKDFNTMPFATSEKIVNIKYNEKKSIDVYIREQDKDRVTYLCSESKLISENVTKTLISSKICSKVK